MAAKKLGMAISIHAPLAGCDLDTSGQPIKGTISIHAPLAGCDKTSKGVKM